jgi:nucleotide-binding universal stress UspA family protein
MMITRHPNPPVIVGVDGSESGVRALDWAGQIAAARSWPLQLVHVVEPYVPGLPLPSRFGISVPEGVSAEVLRDAHRHAKDAWPSLDVTEVSREGSPVRVLLDELTRGRMLVVGRRGIGRFAELMVGSVALASAARASGPVVVVPPTGTWSANAPVVVGVDGSAYGEAAVELAFAEASARRARLEVVHAWDTPSPFSYDFAGYGGAAAWKIEHEVAVAEVIAGWRERYSDVEVQTIIEEGHPVAALVQHGANASLVVVGGRGHGRVADAVMGSIARAVIHHATCPVAVAHQSGVTLDA